MNKKETAAIVTIIAMVAAVGAVTVLASTSLVQQATAQQAKVIVIHVPPGNPANAHEICVSERAAAHHTAQHPGDVNTGIPC